MDADARVYTLYGLRVESEIPLPAPLSADAQPPYDLRLVWGESLTEAIAPAGEELAHLTLPNGRGYTLIDAGGEYALSFYQTALVWIDAALQIARVHLVTGVPPAIAGLLVVGNVIASLLTLRGESVLHASGVAVNGVALAFVGSSGMGKSSLAALLCANGARFVTDDMLRLQPEGAGWRCYSGTGQLRLRQDAADRLNFPAALCEATPDGRVAVNLDADRSMPQLGAVVIPHPSRSCDALTLEQLPPGQALLHLMAYPRIEETPRKANRQRRLDFLGRIAASIPIFDAQMPWGQFCSPAVAAELAQTVGQDDVRAG